MTYDIIVVLDTFYIHCLHIRSMYAITFIQPQDPEERISGTKAGPAKCSSCGQPVGSILFVCLWAQWNPPFVGQDWLEKRMHISGKFWSSRFGRIFVDWVSFTFFFWNHHQMEAMVWDQQTDNIFFWDIREQPQVIQFIEANWSLESGKCPFSFIIFYRK